MRMGDGLLKILGTFLSVVILSFSAFAQTDTATINGRVVDPQGAVVPGVKVQAININTNISYPTETNDVGLYSIRSLPPGTYRVLVEKQGFAQIVKPDVQLHVQDIAELNFSLQIGSVTQSVTVEGGAPLVNTESAAVSTVIDRNFADKLPLNGRSFQTLIQLTPGVVLTASNGLDSGQFSVNGQRASSNYWIVDGVSANIGVNANFLPGSGFVGTVGSFSAQGGTNSLVSVDAMQEFRIQTSTYAPEFGRTPGGQISIVTRPGTNGFHGTLFDYFRNDVLDANDWFANSVRLPKPKERQNDFGGTFSGRLVKDRTFFFFSYEGLRLRLPQAALNGVPDIAARQNAVPTMQPFLNAFPLPNGADNVTTGVARFNASYSNASRLDAYSVRLDDKPNSKLTLFGRYNYSPSEFSQRGNGSPLNVISPLHVTTRTVTVGSTWTISPVIFNDLRFNYSMTDSSSSFHSDNFGGAVPLTSPPFPSPYTSQNALFALNVSSLGQGNQIREGKNVRNLLRQINVVDSLSVQTGSHSLKFGVDFRRLSPVFDTPVYTQNSIFSNVASLQTGNVSFAIITSAVRVPVLLRNFGMFAQDTWRISPPLTLTYGLRWDLDFPPSTTSGASFPAAVSFNDLPNLALAPAGTPAFKTSYGNFAPRIGVSYQLSENPAWGTVLRGGFGVFYDLATEQVGNTFQGSYPFGGLNVPFGGTFPLSSSTAAPPPITPANLASPFATLAVFDPRLQLPYTLEWNIALEQALGKHQSFSASYIGAAGRRLIQTAQVVAPNPNLGSANLISNAAKSDYKALQLQLQRRLSRGLQALVSYTLARSMDDASAASYGVASNSRVPRLNQRENLGPSDFDIRNAFSAAVTYDIPTPKASTFIKTILHGWSVQNIVQARSATPVNVWNFLFGFGQLFSARTQVRPDVISGIPLYLFGSQYPGGKAINNTPGAVVGGCPNGSPSVGPFCKPPTAANGSLLRQGNLGRNALRGFGVAQWDLAVHRDFAIHKGLKLQLRAEMFNVLNHPNFGAPVNDLSNSSQFGRSTKMLGRSLDQSSGGASLSPLYQIGGPRSIQFALKFQF